LARPWGPPLQAASQPELLSTDAADFVVRMPGERTALLESDHCPEAETACRAAQLSIGVALGMLGSGGVPELWVTGSLEPASSGAVATSSSHPSFIAADHWVEFPIHGSWSGTRAMRRLTA
jgi:hypothetical protein